MSSYVPLKCKYKICIVYVKQYKNGRLYYDIVEYNMTSTETSTDVQLGRRVGQVKWFNNKAGYGFITINENDKPNDIFVHYTSIRVTNQYKYLIQGEYVEFMLVKSTTDTHEFQANDVSGINGGSLMCETRNNYQKTDAPASAPRQSTNRDRPPRATEDKKSKDAPKTGDAKAFTTVRRRRPTNDKRSAAAQVASSAV